MSEQLTHKQTFFSDRQFPIVLVLDNITSEANIGSIFRLADAFGVEKLIFCGTQPNLQSNRLRKTARNTHKLVTYEWSDTTTTPLEVLKTRNYKVLGLEITTTSRSIGDFVYQENENIALVLGNERHGISDEILDLCDQLFHVDMYGKNSSMNVAQSAGIALYELTKSIKQFDKK